MVQCRLTTDDEQNTTEETAVCTPLCGTYADRGNVSPNCGFKNPVCYELMEEVENNVFLESSLIELCFLKPTVVRINRKYHISSEEPRLESYGFLSFMSSKISVWFIGCSDLNTFIKLQLSPWD